MPLITASALEDWTLKYGPFPFLSFRFPMRRIVFIVFVFALFLFPFFFFSIADLHFMLIIDVMQFWPLAHN